MGSLGVPVQPIGGHGASFARRLAIRLILIHTLVSIVPPQGQRDSSSLVQRVELRCERMRAFPLMIVLGLGMAVSSAGCITRVKSSEPSPEQGVQAADAVIHVNGLACPF